MKQMAAAGWLVKCGCSAAVLLVACGLATARFGHGLQSPATTTRDGTLVTLNRYAREPVPDVVLVGSSITFRLKEEYFATSKLRNLALAGGSPVTGLAIVANQPRLPKIVLVETNVLSRPVDTELVDRYSRRDESEPLFFRPVRTAVAAYENRRHAPVTHEQVLAALTQLLDQPPADFDNRIYVERARQQSDAEDPTTAVRSSVEKIEQLTRTLEARGTRVLLLELPLSAELENAGTATITRRIVHGEFPDPDRWLRLDIPRDQLRWADGVHLDERSAVMAAQSIDRALASVRGRP